jgi:DNA-binding MarR family transcriptional regulator
LLARRGDRAAAARSPRGRPRRPAANAPGSHYYDLVLSIFVITGDDQRRTARAAHVSAGEPPAGNVTALHQATHVTLHVLAARLSGLGLTAAEQNVLAVLADGRTRPAGELARDTGTRPTTLTSVLDRLERRGYITRGSLAGDRRSVLIELTEPGTQTAAMIRQTLTRLERRALRGLPRDAVAGFYAVLDALAAAGS